MLFVILSMVTTALCQEPTITFTDRDIKNAEMPTAFSYSGMNYRHNGLIVPLPTKKLEIAAYHFGALEGEVGVVGLTKRFRPKHWLSLSFGGGTIFGHGERTGPALLAGIDAEKHITRNNALLAEASLTQAFRTFPEPEHGQKTRSNHDQYFTSSIGWKYKSWVARMNAEKFQHREESEWSYGPGMDRLLGRTGLYLSGSVFFPGTAWVLGMGFNPGFRHKE